MDSIEALLGIALSFVFGWNNSSLLIGNVKASGSLSYKTTSLIAVTGLAAGYLLEGIKMSSSLSNLVYEAPSQHVINITLLVSLIITLIFSLLNLPISFSIVIVGSYVGAGYSLSIQSLQLAELAFFWVVAPVLSGLFSFIIYNYMKKLVSNLDIIKVDIMNRAGIFIAGLASAYSLGGNNIGLIASILPNDSSFLPKIIILIFALIGTIALGGRNVSGSVGDRLMSLSPQAVFSVFIASSIFVWIGTQFSLPISMSQCLLGGMFGAAYSAKIAVLNKKLAYETVLSWIAVPIVGFFLAFLLSSIW